MENYSKNKIIEILKLFKYMGFEKIYIKKSPFHELKKEIENCKKCELWKNRNNTVFGKGPFNAKIFFIGEAPGREEDLQGEPFVGMAGKKLDEMFEKAGINPKEVFITNVVKCRPPGNRAPTPYEIMKCNSYLVRQIKLINPSIIVLLGNIPLSLVSGDFEGISKVRGKRLEYLSYPAIPTFHPAYVVRNPESEEIVIEDFKRVLRSVS
ncbi:MAG: uracil-DNA glycosylase [candidate division WOR-3 bacterium]